MAGGGRNLSEKAGDWKELLRISRHLPLRIITYMLQFNYPLNSADFESRAFGLAILPCARPPRQLD